MDRLVPQNKTLQEKGIISKQILLGRGYIQLPLGSYYRWIHKKFFDQLIEKKVLVRNKLGQYVPDMKMAFELKRFDEQYKKWMWEQEKTKQFKTNF